MITHYEKRKCSVADPNPGSGAFLTMLKFPWASLFIDWHFGTQLQRTHTAPAFFYIMQILAKAQRIWNLLPMTEWTFLIIILPLILGRGTMMLHAFRTCARGISLVPANPLRHCQRFDKNLAHFGVILKEIFSYLPWQLRSELPTNEEAQVNFKGSSQDGGRAKFSENLRTPFDKGQSNYTRFNQVRLARQFL